MRFLPLLLTALLMSSPVGAEAAGAVTRAVFTTQVTDREPVDQVSSFTNDVTRVFFFTEITNMPGVTVKHRWLYEGELKAEVSFAIGGPSWRVWSSKNMLPAWTGQWTVQVVDANGTVLAEKQMNYMPAGENANPDQ